MIRKFTTPIKILERARVKDGKEFWHSLSLNVWIQLARQFHRVHILKKNFQEKIYNEVKALKPVP